MFDGKMYNADFVILRFGDFPQAFRQKKSQNP